MTTKKIITILALAVLAATSWRSAAQSNFDSDPAYLPIEKAFDLQSIKPEVNINLPRFLLLDAFSDFNGGPEDPFAKAGIKVSELVKDIKLIRLVVIEANKTNRLALTNGVASLRRILESNWTPVLSVGEENIGIYALGDSSGENMAGLALLVHDDGDAVIANIVGRVSLSKIIKLAGAMDKFPKDLLKKLTAAGGDATKPKNDGAKPKSETEPAKSNK